MWTLNSIRLFVQNFPENDKQIVARLQPLKSGTIHQIFGYEDTIYTLSAVVVGNADKDSLKALSKTGLSYDLVTPYGTIEDLIVNNVSVKQRLGVICQTIRTDLDLESPVFDVEIELYKDIT